MAESQDFVYLLEDIAEVKARQEDKSVSLNEAERLKEEEEQKAQLAARKEERLARVTNNDHIYELDLEGAQAGTPLKPYEPEESEELAGVGTEVPVDEEEVDAGPVVDAQLEEIVQILRDYVDIASGGKPAVVLKASTQ